MRIENETHWRTDYLRAFARRVANDHLDPEHRKELVVQFVNALTRGVSGYAYYGQVWHRGRLCRFVKLRLPTGNPRRPSSRIRRWAERYAQLGPDYAIRAMTYIAERSRPGDPPDKRAIAAVLEHEFGHILGRKHPGCRGPNVMRGHYDAEELALDRYSWADELPLEKSA